MATETGVDTETETETETVTRSAAACAMGAGALGITCKAMVLGFFVSGLGLVGLSGVSPLALMAGVAFLASVFMWKGTRWAGRRPAYLGVGGIVAMFLGYTASGLFVTSKGAGGSRELFGSYKFGMFPAQDILANPMGLIPVALLYIAGTVLIFAAIYDSYIKEMDVFDSKGGMAAGVAGASICGGCGLTGLAGAGMVLLTGASATNDTKFLGADAVMLLGVLGILAYTAYKRAWLQTAVAAVGVTIAFFLTGGLFGFPAENGLLQLLGVTFPPAGASGWVASVWDMVGVMITWIGLGIAFYALIWAAYPQLEILPEEWKDDVLGSDPAEPS